MAFVRFGPGGAEGMDDFNRRAHALFVRHGMYVESMLETATTVTPVGEKLKDVAPERVAVFFQDEASALRSYVLDAE